MNYILRLKDILTIKNAYIKSFELLPPELIPFILKNLSIQDLKKCCSINNIWKDEVILEIRRRLIVDCTFVNEKATVKALIDPKYYYSSINTETFVIVDKPEYDMVLGNNWLVGLRYRIDKRDARYWENIRYDLSEYYDSEYTETESECSSSETESESKSFSSESEDEVTYVNDVPPMIMDTADTPNDFITTFSD
ncbi:170_t:CDS:2 [Rhizophagus irregularis]|nr:170_t:CDS:2 [Rhizophagus irregularis]